MSTEQRQPQVGDKMIALDGSSGEVLIAAVAKVTKITPTGIIVLDNGDRLDPRYLGDVGYAAKGRGAYDRRPAYFRPADDQSDLVAIARANTSRRNAANRVTAAHSAWERDWRDADLAVALRDRVNEYLLILEGRTPSGSNQ